MVVMMMMVIVMMVLILITVALISIMTVTVVTLSFRYHDHFQYEQNILAQILNMSDNQTAPSLFCVKVVEDETEVWIHLHLGRHLGPALVWVWLRECAQLVAWIDQLSSSEPLVPNTCSDFPVSRGVLHGF